MGWIEDLVGEVPGGSDLAGADAALSDGTNVTELSGLVQAANAAATWANNLLHQWGLQPRLSDGIERQISGNRSMWQDEAELNAWRAWVQQAWPGVWITGDVWEQPFYGAWQQWTQTQRAVRPVAGAPVIISMDGTEFALGEGRVMTREEFLALKNKAAGTGGQGNEGVDANSPAAKGGKRGGLYVALGVAAVALLLFTSRDRGVKGRKKINWK